MSIDALRKFKPTSPDLITKKRLYSDATLAPIAYVNELNDKLTEVITEVNALSIEGYKGVIDCSTNPNYPAGIKDWYWRVSVAGKIGGGSGLEVEVGDMIICIVTNGGGTQAAVGANFMIVQKNQIPCTVTVLRAGTNDTDYVTAKTLADQGMTFATTTILGLSGGTTEQLLLTTTAAQKGLTITSTLQTGRLIDISTTVADASVNLVNLIATMSTDFTTAKYLVGQYVSLTSGATDVDDSAYIGHNVSLVSTALSKADAVGYRVIHSGTASGALGIQNYIGFLCAPTITLNSTSNFYGVSVDLTGLTNTVSNDVYGIKVIHSGQADAALIATDGTRTVWLADNSYALYTRGSNAFDGTTVTSGNMLNYLNIALTTGSLVNYMGITTKTGGYLFNGSMTTSTLTDTFIYSDFSQGCHHDGIGADTLIGERFVWSGNTPNGTLASSLTIKDIQYSGIFGTAQNKGGDLVGLNVEIAGTINDASALEYGVKITLSTTLTSAAAVYGLYMTTPTAVTSAARFITTTGGDVSINSGGSTSGIWIGGTLTNAMYVDTTTAKTNIINVSAAANMTNFMTVDAVGGFVIANALVPAAAPDAGTVGADACLKIMIGATPYYIPLYDTLHA